MNIMSDKKLYKEAGLSFRLGDEVLTESTKRSLNESGSMLVKGIPATILGRKNANGRVYSKKEMIKSVQEAKDKGLFADKRLTCTGDDHPDTTFVKPTHSSHVVVDAYVKDVKETSSGKTTSVLFNDFLVLSTDSGRNLQALLKEGVAVGTSIRGLGRYNESTSEIEDYEFLGTDIVGQPSAGTYISNKDFNTNIVVESVQSSNDDSTGEQQASDNSKDVTQENDSSNVNNSLINSNSTMSDFNFNEKFASLKESYDLSSDELEVTEALKHLCKLEKAAVSAGVDVFAETEFKEFKEGLLSKFNEEDDEDDEDEDDEDESSKKKGKVKSDRVQDFANKKDRTKEASELLLSKIQEENATLSEKVEASTELLAKSLKKLDQFKESKNSGELIERETVVDIVEKVLVNSRAAIQSLRQDHKEAINERDSLSRQLKTSLDISDMLVEELRGLEKKEYEYSRTVESKLKSSEIHILGK